jgi:DNA polymerase/3'-5' exonuclease PolX
LVFLYKEAEDDSRAGTFQEALDNMLDLSNHNYEHYNKDKHGNIIGIGHEDMGTDMVKDDVKCLRDIHCVGASTVKLIEEWIETGTMKTLEDLRKEATPSITERVRYTLNGEEFEAKKD